MNLLFASFVGSSAVALIALAFLSLSITATKRPMAGRIVSLAIGSLLFGVADLGVYWLYRGKINNIPLVHLTPLALWLFWLRPVVHSIRWPRIKPLAWGIWWSYLPLWVVGMASGGFWTLSPFIWPAWGMTALILVGIGVISMLPGDWKWVPSLAAIGIFALTTIGPVLSVIANRHAWIAPWTSRSVLVLASCPFFALALVLHWSQISTGRSPQPSA